MYRYVCVHKVDALLDITVLTSFGKGGEIRPPVKKRMIIIIMMIISKRLFSAIVS